MVTLKRADVLPSRRAKSPSARNMAFASKRVVPVISSIDISLLPPDAALRHMLPEIEQRGTRAVGQVKTVLRGYGVYRQTISILIKQAGPPGAINTERTLTHIERVLPMDASRIVPAPLRFATFQKSASPQFQHLRVDMKNVVGDIVNEDELLRFRRQAAARWFRDIEFNRLRQLAHSLGVSKIVLASRIGSDDCQGEYYWRVNPASIGSSLDAWKLSDSQKSSIRATVKRDGAVIVLHVFADDLSEILRHELGHHIADYLCDLRMTQLWAAPKNAGRTDSRIDDYCRKNTAEYIAESFRFYLSGEPMRQIDLRPVLRRVCMNNTRAYSFLRQFRLAAA